MPIVSSKFNLMGQYCISQGFEFPHPPLIENRGKEIYVVPFRFWGKIKRIFIDQLFIYAI